METPIFFEVLQSEGKNISEDFSVFMRRFDVFEDKKEFTLGDVLSVLPDDLEPLSLIINGRVFFKDMIRGWIPDEMTLVFRCERSMRGYTELQNTK